MNLPLKRIRLRAMWIMVPLFLYFARPTLTLLALGAALALPGVLLRAWAAGTVRKNVKLATGGPYAHTRNPLYLGTFLMGAGAVVAGGQVLFVIGFMAFFGLVYGATMRREEAYLEGVFGDEFRAYSRAVPLFLPRLTPYQRGEEASAFDLERYLRNREYQAALGVLAGFLILSAKLLWP
jgi:protein-S-isoprenylcysteine O-methyltransferase Ste14